MIFETNQNIFLCGFMGCGKTTMAKYISQMQNKKFIDLDEYIENKTNKQISTIFLTMGEKCFREIETTCLKLICEKYKNKTIISTGGGTIISKFNADIINNSGISVYLNLKFKYCYENIKKDKKVRPLNKNINYIKYLYKKRTPIYKNHCFVEIRI